MQEITERIQNNQRKTDCAVNILEDFTWIKKNIDAIEANSKNEIYNREHRVKYHWFLLCQELLIILKPKIKKLSKAT